MFTSDFVNMLSVCVEGRSNLGNMYSLEQFVVQRVSMQENILYASTKGKVLQTATGKSSRLLNFVP